MFTMLRKFRMPTSLVAMISLLSVGFAAPGYAAMVGTPDIIVADQGLQQKAYIKQMLQRDDIKAKLVEMGVDPQQAVERVDALTDEEARTLAANLEDIPAGGSVLGLLAFVLIVLLITDILGLTDVYSI